MIKAGDVSIDPYYVASTWWDRGHSYTTLVVRMHDGYEHRIRHTENAPGWGVNAYDVEQAIFDAKTRLRRREGG